MKKLLCLLLSISLATPIKSFGACDKPVSLLKEGEPSPCTGFLFTREKEKEVYLLVEDQKLLKKELEFRNKQIELIQKDNLLADSMITKEREKAELWRKVAEDSTKELVSSKDRQGTRDLIMILTGVLITVGAGYALGQVQGK